MTQDFARKIQDVHVPAFLYGTAWKEDDTQRCVEEAIAAGFRGVDTANQRKHYYEKGVGEALKTVFAKGELQRSDIFLQTKFTSVFGQDKRLPYDPDDSLTNQVAQSFQSSLKHLGTDYLDSYVLHGPMTRTGLTDEDWEVWRAIENLYESKKTKLIGVSNVSHEQLRLLTEGAKVKPAFVQNRCFARLGWDKDVRKLCQREGIVYQGFSLLTANQEIFQQPQFHEIVRRTERTPAQVVFRFALQLGMLPLTGTTKSKHMKEDLAITDFELSESEMNTIEKILL